MKRKVIFISMSVLLLFSACSKKYPIQKVKVVAPPSAMIPHEVRAGQQIVDARFGPQQVLTVDPRPEAAMPSLSSVTIKEITASKAVVKSENQKKKAVVKKIDDNTKLQSKNRVKIPKKPMVLTSRMVWEKFCAGGILSKSDWDAVEDVDMPYSLTDMNCHPAWSGEK